MKTLTALVLSAMVWMASALPTLAQHTGAYVVQPGDDLSTIAATHLGSELRWRELMEKNKWLHERGPVQIANGKVNVLIYPGERLEGVLPDASNWIRPLTPSSYDDLARFAVPGQRSGVRVLAEASWAHFGLLHEVDRELLMSALPTLLGALATLFVLMFFLWARRQWRRREKEHELSADPTGPNPIVPGGVTKKTVRAYAVQAIAQRYPGSSVEDFTVIDVQEGLASGVVSVHYANNSWHERRLNNEAAFEARIRKKNGLTETVLMLERCGNDIRIHGMKYRPGDDFLFVPTKRSKHKAATLHSVNTSRKA